jgi:hypothetical protein
MLVEISMKKKLLKVAVFFFLIGLLIGYILFFLLHPLHTRIGTPAVANNTAGHSAQLK